MGLSVSEFFRFSQGLSADLRVVEGPSGSFSETLF